MNAIRHSTALLAALALGCGGAEQTRPTANDARSSAPAAAVDPVRCSQGQLDACDAAMRATVEWRQQQIRHAQEQAAPQMQQIRCAQGQLDACDPTTRSAPVGPRWVYGQVPVLLGSSTSPTWIGVTGTLACPADATDAQRRANADAAQVAWTAEADEAKGALSDPDPRRALSRLAAMSRDDAPSVIADIRLKARRFLDCYASLVANPQDFEKAASAAADSLDRVVAIRTPEARRADVCETVLSCRGAAEGIRRERANPGGVVDLKLLHDLGETLQACPAMIAARKAAYTAVAQQPFDDSVCN